LKQKNVRGIRTREKKPSREKRTARVFPKKERGQEKSQQVNKKRRGGSRQLKRRQP